MRESILTVDQVQQLFDDIQSLATDILLMQRTTHCRQAEPSRANKRAQLVMARDALLSGSLTRLQLRYRWNNSDWIDTLERRDQGFRLVRIVHGN